MLSERLLTSVVRECTKNYLRLEPTQERRVPGPKPGQKYMLYMHVPFCERLCPYCSFNRFPFAEERAVPYFANLRKEMLMLKDLGYDFDSVYVGGGTPTIMIDELCDTIDLARETFSIKEVSSETNPNHLIPAYLDKLQGRVQRLSVGVQSFDDDLLKQMDRYEKYGSGDVILERIAEAEPYFDSLNVDMIFNFPSQTEDVLMADLEKNTAYEIVVEAAGKVYVPNVPKESLTENDYLDFGTGAQAIAADSGGYELFCGSVSFYAGEGAVLKPGVKTNIGIVGTAPDNNGRVVVVQAEEDTNISIDYRPAYL